MCGIAGIVAQKGRPPATAVDALTRHLRHRGPDERGQHHDGQVSLTHTRLSIIDLDGGQQPMFGEDRHHCLIANGEIYNFPAIRERLIGEGQAFRTRSDCEVILPLYQRHGRACVQHLRGMFAFAIWDAGRRKLLLGRDRMGEKPLYYAFTDDHLVFASELRALLKTGLVDRTLDPRQIARYFRYQYVPEPATPFLGIRKLPAACTLELDLDAWTIDVQPYWNAFDAEPIETDPVSTIRAALDDAVTTSLISDVPIGVSLSGGIDSSILACLAARHSAQTVEAISIGYPDAANVDERPQAKTLAARLGIPFHSVELDDRDMLSCFREVVAARDDPIGDIAGYNYYAIMRHARAHGLKVMLQGHGLDELCWGYPWVQGAVAINEGRTSASGGRTPAGGSWRHWLKRTLGRSPTPAAAHPGQFQMFELQPYTAFVDRHADGMFTSGFRERADWPTITPAKEYGKTGLRTDLEVTRLIVDFYLRENGIAQGDRLSMAHGVEMRLPFVDHRLVETIIGLRKAARDDHLSPKHWLKESVRDLLGDEIIDRPKRGFSPPSARWQKALRERFGKELEDGLLVAEGIIEPAFAKRLAAPAGASPPEDTVGRLAIILETWARSILDVNSDSVDAEPALLEAS